MYQFEKNLFSSNHSLLSYVVHWYKYVDDIVSLRSGPPQLIYKSPEPINNQYLSVRFTLETGGVIINFLDLLIIIDKGHHEFGILRKNTATDTFIHTSSFCHPFDERISSII